MKKMMMAVAGLAMAVVMTGCGGSPKGVAEKFALAIVQKDPGKALEFYDADLSFGGRSFESVAFKGPAKRRADLKKTMEDDGKKIGDDKYECEAVLEEVEVGSDERGYTLINGKKYIAGETATVYVQFVKGKDRKADGITVSLVKLDGKWTVYSYRLEKDKYEVSDKK